MGKTNKKGKRSAAKNLITDERILADLHTEMRNCG